MKNTKAKVVTLFIFFIMVASSPAYIQTTSAYYGGYVNFNMIQVKSQESGQEEFKLEFGCKDSDGDWRSDQESFAYNIAAPGDFTKYYYYHYDATGQKLSTASYEPFTLCYDKSGSDIRVRLIENDPWGGDDDMTGWLYIEISSAQSYYHYKNGDENSWGFKVKVEY